MDNKLHYKEKEVGEMDIASYIAIQKRINYQNSQIKWICEGFLLTVSKLTINLLMVIVIYKVIRFLRCLNKIERYCFSCEKKECDGVLSQTEDLIELRDCLQKLIGRIENKAIRFLVSWLRKLTDEIDNKIENYSIGSDQELMHLVSSISAKYSNK
jgi:hypothetical protein